VREVYVVRYSKGMKINLAVECARREDREKRERENIFYLRGQIRTV
jgi:hypothetical protein